MERKVDHGYIINQQVLAMRRKGTGKEVIDGEMVVFVVGYDTSYRVAGNLYGIRQGSQQELYLIANFTL